MASKENIKSILIILLAVGLGIFIFRELDRKFAPPVHSPVPVSPSEDDRDAPEAGETISGTVEQYGSNRMGDIDKIQLRTSDGEYWLHFPPHTAKKVIAIATLHRLVKAGLESGDPGDDAISELIWIQSGNPPQKQVISDIPPPAPSTGVDTTFSGNRISIQSDDHGHVIGFILDGVLVELKPKAAETLQPYLASAKEVTVKGVARNPQDGFVNNHGYVLVKPVSINIDHVNYLVP